MAKLQIRRSDLLLEHPRLLDSIARRVNHSSFPMEDQVRLVQYIQVPIPEAKNDSLER